MPASLQSIRRPFVDNLLMTLAHGGCCAIYGLSNTGKSPLLRGLPAPENAARYARGAGRPGALIYIDCNRVVELTVPGFFEVVVRSMVEALEEDGAASASPTVLQHLQDQHTRITMAASTFQASLAFNTAISECYTHLGRDLILLFDEFDEVYTALEDRTLLNLRALKDKFRSRLAYTTATVRPLTDHSLRGENEFTELFTTNLLPLGPLSEADAQLVMDDIGGRALSLELRQTVIRAAGGHFGLLNVLTAAALRHPQAPTADPNVRAECLKIWNQLRPDEQAALRSLATQADDGLNPFDREHLQAFGLVDEHGQIFSELFTAFIRRQNTAPEAEALGVRVDEDAGEVWVDGVKITVLTDLEYRLMRLLSQRVDRLTTKEMIVEAVWGGQYLDRMDDARIEKLVSRLRAKIEPDPLHPRYLITQRGRGYKLVSRPAEAKPEDEDS
jgi:DNA-binding winged helix-turn-helix (wHTH) protein/GTP-binding protein EngB required for normal cell division